MGGMSRCQNCQACTPPCAQSCSVLSNAMSDRKQGTTCCLDLTTCRTLKQTSTAFRLDMLVK